MFLSCCAEAAVGEAPGGVGVAARRVPQGPDRGVPAPVSARLCCGHLGVANYFFVLNNS